MFQEVIDKIIPEKSTNNIRDDEYETINELLLNQRMLNMANNPDLKNSILQNNQTMIPPELKRG